jgi:hypothetical protein
MRDLSLLIAGVLAILTAVIHSVLGETKIFARARIEPEPARLLLRLVWQSGSIFWAGAGVLLLAAPYMESEIARHWIVIVCAVMFGSAALGNAWSSRGRHFGWMMLAGVVVFAFLGL